MTHDLIMPVLMARESQMQKVAKGKYIGMYITDKFIHLKAMQSKQINYNQFVR